LARKNDFRDTCGFICAGVFSCLVINVVYTIFETKRSSKRKKTSLYNSTTNVAEDLRKVELSRGRIGRNNGLRVMSVSYDSLMDGQYE